MATIQIQDKDWTEKNRRHLAIARSGVTGKFKHPKVQGLFIRVSPKGKAVWAFKFRDCFKAEQAETLGEVGEVTEGVFLSLDDAVSQYKQLYTHHMGKATPGRLTLEKGFEDYLRDHTKKGGGALSSRTIGDYEGVYRRFLKEEAADLYLERTTLLEWRDILDRAKAKSAQQARRAFWLLHGIYSHQMELKVLKENPLAGRTLRDRFSGDDTKVIRDTHVAAIDLKSFVEGVMQLSIQSRDAILCLLLTGWRLSAVLRLRWDQIDWEEGTYRVLPGELGWKGYVGKMALNSYVLSILVDRYAHRQSTTIQYVFPARHGDKDYMQDLRGSLVKASTGLNYVVMAHDLRRTFATLADVVLTGNGRLIGLLLGHKQPASEQPDETRGTTTTNKYIQRNYLGERVSGSKVAEAILVVAEQLPMDDETVKPFIDRGMDIKKPLPLVEMEDDEQSEAA